MADVLQTRPVELSAELGTSPAEAVKLLQLVRDYAARGSAQPEPAAGAKGERDRLSDSGPAAHPDALGTHGEAGSALHVEPLPRPSSFLDRLRKERSQAGIVTFCAALDEMLGCGVPLGKTTEFCGAPGIGKTQLGYVPRGLRRADWSRL